VVEPGALVLGPGLVERLLQQRGWHVDAGFFQDRLPRLEADSAQLALFLVDEGIPVVEGDGIDRRGHGGKGSERHGGERQGATNDLDRDERLAVCGLAGRVLSTGAPRRAVAGALRGQVPDRGAEQLLLPPSYGGRLPRMAGANAAGLRHRGEG